MNNPSFKLVIIIWVAQLCSSEECDKLKAVVSTRSGLLTNYERNIWVRLNDKLNNRYIYRTRFQKKVLHDISLSFQHFVGYQKDRYFNNPTTKEVVSLGSGYSIFSTFDSFLYLNNSTDIREPLYQYFNGSFDLDKNITFNCQSSSGGQDVAKQSHNRIRFGLKDKLYFLLWSTLLITMMVSC